MDTNSTRVGTSPLADAVVSALDSAGITRNAAADLTGIPRETFYRKCKGVGKSFDADEQKAIADLLGIKVSELWARAEAAA